MSRRTLFINLRDIASVIFILCLCILTTSAVYEESKLLKDDTANGLDQLYHDGPVTQKLPYCIRDLSKLLENFEAHWMKSDTSEYLDFLPDISQPSLCLLQYFSNHDQLCSNYVAKQVSPIEIQKIIHREKSYKLQDFLDSYFTHLCKLDAGMMSHLVNSTENTYRFLPNILAKLEESNLYDGNDGKIFKFRGKRDIDTYGHYFNTKEGDVVAMKHLPLGKPLNGPEEYKTSRRLKERKYFRAPQIGSSSILNTPQFGLGSVVVPIGLLVLYTGLLAAMGFFGNNNNNRVGLTGPQGIQGVAGPAGVPGVPGVPGRSRSRSPSTP